jgi:predicted AlkP superfamily phosphohydrolase/phosphomutase
MKILVIGLEGATPELLFGEERLINFRRLMEGGCYGRLESVVPPTAVPAWLSMATGQDPGSLGIYSSRNRVSRSYRSNHYRDMELSLETALWNQLGRQGGRSLLMGVPVPAKVRWENTERVDEYRLEENDFPASDRNQLKDDIYAASRTHFETVRRHLRDPGWNYLQFLESGLDRLQHTFWHFHDPQHMLYEPGNPYETVIRDYYLYLDGETGKILEMLNEDTVILVISCFGAQRLDGIFCVNEWLLEEGLLVLNDYPKGITPFYDLNVNWEKTKAWSEGEYCASVFFNVKGREPNGTIEPADFETLRDEIKSRFEISMDEERGSLEIRVFKPEEIYKTVKGVAPDLILQVGKDSWRADDGVGYRSVCFPAKSEWEDRCSPTNLACFILAADNNPLQGEIEEVHLLDIAPTLLEIAGREVPALMQGKSLLSGKMKNTANTGQSTNEEEAIRERLRGLGYI